jgi:hypothetical protein
MIVLEMVSDAFTVIGEKMSREVRCTQQHLDNIKVEVQLSLLDLAWIRNRLPDDGIKHKLSAIIDQELERIREECETVH